MNKKFQKYLVYGLLACSCLTGLGLLPSCRDEAWLDDLPSIQVEEGIPGQLSLTLVVPTSEERQVAARNSELPSSEQHLHSAYVFVIDKPQDRGPEDCRILSRTYFPDIQSSLETVQEGGYTLQVSRLQLPAISSQRAQVFVIANLGYSDLQGVENDADLLDQCDHVKNLADLQALSARLITQEDGWVSVERMQGHHLMSGFLGAADQERHFLHEPPVVTLKSDGKGGLQIYDARGRRMCPLGSRQPSTGASACQVPCAAYVHRLDAKISFEIIPSGDFKDIPGASFRLVSWQVLNLPNTSALYWQQPSHRQAPNCSKVFQRDLNQGEDGSWKFSFYQFENAACPLQAISVSASRERITAETIARQYRKEYGLKEPSAPTAKTVKEAFEARYPNPFSNFAYSLRELQQKQVGETGGDALYEPGQPGQDDQVIVVKNGAYEYAPQEATYVRLIGRYYNPQEPVKRMKDDPRSMKFEKVYPLDQYPYWGENKKPVATPAEALKRTRSATVMYYVHLGYVGGGNYQVNENPVPSSLTALEGGMRLPAYEEKVNDYNVLRNHHYTYKLHVAGVENIKLEATREDQGNILEQEKQPGAEGNILESQHFYDLDAHFEVRQLTLDFTRFPEDYTKGFTFAVSTPFDLLHLQLKAEEGTNDFKFFDRKGQVVTSIRNHDWDWIHFAWHGSLEDPYRSLIDPQTGNGISYSQTYGGYENQQTYIDTGRQLTQTQDAAHPYRLLNSLEFSELVWRLFVKWVELGKSETHKTVTFTLFVDENYYDYNPATNEQVNWWQFCNQPKRKAFYFMEPEEISADQNSWYADAHLAVYQQSIQTLYATDNKQGQVVANVAFGIEALDEFRAKYARGKSPFVDGDSRSNGLFNIMNWYQKKKKEVIDWETAETRFNDLCRAIVPDQQGRTDHQPGGANRAQRNPIYALYSRNRDLNRNGKLDPFEVRWFVPAVEQYTLCFLGGRPVFENPLFEKDKAVKPAAGSEADSWLHGVPVLHYITSTKYGKNEVFWAEEGCSMGKFNQGKVDYLYSIRMARMLCRHGVEDTGQAFASEMKEDVLRQDAVFTVSHEPNGVPVDYDQRVDGKPYYIVINKMNAHAFRDRVRIGELAQHTHEEKENWLYRSYRIAQHKVGYTAYQDATHYDRTVKLDGIPRTWWQLNGVWTDETYTPNSNFYYRGEEHSLAYTYTEKADGSDLHHWRMPNLREAAIMSMAFPSNWFNGSITSGTTSDNLGPQSTKIPFWNIQSGQIGRLQNNSQEKFFVRPIQDCAPIP